MPTFMIDYAQKPNEPIIFGNCFVVDAGSPEGQVQIVFRHCSDIQGPDQKSNHRDFISKYCSTNKQCLVSSGPVHSAELAAFLAVEETNVFPSTDEQPPMSGVIFNKGRPVTTPAVGAPLPDPFGDGDLFADIAPGSKTRSERKRIQKTQEIEEGEGYEGEPETARKKQKLPKSTASPMQPELPTREKPGGSISLEELSALEARLIRLENAEKSVLDRVQQMQKEMEQTQRELGLMRRVDALTEVNRALLAKLTQEQQQRRVTQPRSALAQPPTSATSRTAGVVTRRFFTEPRETALPALPAGAPIPEEELGDLSDLFGSSTEPK